MYGSAAWDYFEWDVFGGGITLIFRVDHVVYLVKCRFCYVGLRGGAIVTLSINNYTYHFENCKDPFNSVL